jgi:hypothetical protein
MTVVMYPHRGMAMTEVELVAIAICKSRTCQGIDCCQWPANGGRLQCPVKNGGYDDAARDAIQALDSFRDAEKRKNCKHYARIGTGCAGSDGSGWSTWFCQECGASYDSRHPVGGSRCP